MSKRVSIPLCLFLLFWAAGCDYGRMNDQEAIRTYALSVPEAPPGTIPVAGGIEMLKHQAPGTLKNPLPDNRDSVVQGKTAYGYYCVHCHGPRADGKGTVGQSFAPLPASLRGAAVQSQGDGALFAKISLGFRRHPPLASTVSVEERWATIRYIRSLAKEP